MTAANADHQPGELSGRSPAPPASSGAGGPKRAGGRFRRICLWLVGVVAVIAGIITFAPAPLARLILHYYLDDLGIDVSGEQTLDINLWKGQIAFGPVNFKFGDAAPGQVSRLGLDFSIPRLVSRRALVTTLTIEGLDLKLTQTPEGELRLNGVPLSNLLASEPKAAEPQAEEAATDKKSAWGAGLDSFELKNSKLTFVTQQGRQAQLQIDNLGLIGFRTWQPDDPGTFSLSGQINGISVNAEGEARPFAEELRVGLKYQIEGIELAKIQQFTGPLGFERNAGTFALEGAGEISQLLKGGTSIASSGEVSIDGLDLSMPGAVAVGIRDGKSAFELRTQLEPDGAFNTAGSVSIDAATGRVQIPDGPDVSFDHASMPTADMALSLAADGGMQLRGVPTLDIAKPAMTGPVHVSGDRLALKLTDLGVDSSAKGTDVTTSGTVTLEQPRVEVPAAGGAQGLKAQSTGFDVALTDVAVKQSQDGIHITGGGAKINPGTLQLSLPGENAASAPFVATLDKLSLTLNDLALDTAQNEMRFKTSANASLTSIAGNNERQPPVAGSRTRPPAARGSASSGSSVAVGPISIALPSLELTQQPDKLQITATMSSAWSKLQATLRDIPARPGLTFSDLKLDTSPLTLEMTGKGMRVAGNANIGLSDADARWDSAVAAARGATVESRGSATALTLALSGADLRTSGGGADGKAALRLTGRNLRMASPELDTVAGGQVGVDKLQAEVKEITAGRPPAPAWRLAFDATLDALSTGKANAIPRMEAKRVEIRNLAIDDRGSVDADAFIITKTDAAISRSWLTRLGGDPAAEQVAKTAIEVAQRAEKEKAPLRIGRLRVEDSANVNFEDDILKPPARFALKIDSFDMGELNSAKPDGRTDVFLRAKLNEFTPIEAQGWAEVLAAKPDFALNASVKYLQLPQLSPYTAQAIGVNIESGRLTVNADATAKQGELQGVIKLAANSLELGSVSAETASHAENTIGVPLNTALGLLEDDDGRIELSIPLSGNLASPSFDPGDVIAQAMTNVVKGAVLAPFKLALLPVTLLAGAAEGSVPKLAPISFEANTDVPDAQGKTVLEALATLLRDQSKLKVQVCGRATQADRQAALQKQALPDESDPIYPTSVADLRAGLGQLAQARTSVVRRILSDQYSIPRRQVLECRSAYEESDPGAPRLAIKF